VALSNTLVIAQGKGGVGKTSLAANIAGLAAHQAELSVLLIDLDQQGNLCRDLGVPRSDGSALFQALTTGKPVPVTSQVRPRLDLVAGGPAVADLAGVMFSRMTRGGMQLDEMLRQSLQPIADDYQLVVIDTPPGERIAVEAAMSIARFLVIPTGADDGSIDGLELTAQRFVNARTRNPELELLGVVLFAIADRAKAIERETRAIVEQIIGPAAPVFPSRIRYQAAAAVDARRKGLLIHELESKASGLKARRLAQLGKGDATPSGIDLRTRDAKGLTDDYWTLTFEILTAMNESLSREATSA
jgi:cellulose biosynthesis protein BcsQ